MNPGLQTFSEPVDFLRRAEAFLEAHETINNLILGVATRLVQLPGWTEEPPYLAVVESAPGQISLAAVMTPNRLMLASSPEIPVEEQDAAVAAVISSLRAENWPVPGVTAENSLAQRFANRWSRVTRQGSQVRMRMRVYELRQVIRPTNPPPGFLRPVAMDDLETITQWVYGFHAESTPDEADWESARKMALCRIETQDSFLWDDGGPVSMAIRTRPTRHGYTISGVYTPPEMRGRGYASACVAELSQRLLDSGKQFCNLFTDLSNPTSNAIYQKIGYYPLCDFLELGFTAE